MRNNLVYQFVGQGLGKALALIFFIYLARLLGKNDFGKFSYLLTVCFIFAQPLVQLGLDNLVTKWVSRLKFGVLKTAFQLRLAMVIPAFLIIVGFSKLFKLDRTPLYILFSYIVFLSMVNLLFSFLRGRERMKLEGIFTPLQRAFSLALLWFITRINQNSVIVGSVSLLFPPILTLAATALFMRNDLKRAWSTNIETIGRIPLFKEGTALSLVTFLWMIYFRIDTLMLGLLQDDLEVGIYNAAYRLTEGIYFLPSVILMVYFPRLARNEEFKKLYHNLFKWLTVLGIFTSVVVYLSAPWIIKILYTDDFIQSVPVLKILAIAIFFVFIGHLTTQSLIALDKNKTYLVFTSLGAAINVILNLMLIPSYGSLGAAWATSLTECLVLAGTGLAIWKHSVSV